MIRPTVTVEVFDRSWRMWRRCPQQARMDRGPALCFALKASEGGHTYRLVEDTPQKTIIATFSGGRRS